MNNGDTTEPSGRVLIRLDPSPVRRVMGASVFVVLGGLLVWLSLSTSPALGWQVILVAGGALAIFFGVRLWQVSAVALELTEVELREVDGRRLALVSEITTVERGAFAFKPSNGFLVRLREPAARVYVPGIWWRIGRKVGVGGITNVGQAKAMSEILTALIRERGE